MIGFAAYKKDSEQRYAVRGTGIEFEEFSDWARSRVVVVNEDWPWTAFVFRNKSDEDEFLEKYDTPDAYFDKENN